MSTQIIGVLDDRGIYDLPLGATSVSWSDFAKERADNPYVTPTLTVESAESLVGWAPWEYVVSIDGNSYFVRRTRSGEPWPPEIAVAVGAAIIV